MRKWRVLVADDMAEYRKYARQALEALKHPEAPLGFEILEEKAFEQFEHRVRAERFDLIILDIRKDEAPANETAGVDAHSKMLEDLFVPTVFYTAHADKANPKAAAFVGVVNKSDGVDALSNAVKAILDSRLLRVRDFLDKQQVALIRDSLPQFAQRTGTDANCSIEMSARLARAIGRALASSEIRTLLGLSEETLHPEECYIVPPAMPHPMTGDLYAQDDAGKITYWVVLNPACDLVDTPTRKCRLEGVLAAKCSFAQDNDRVMSAKAALAKAGELDGIAKQAEDVAKEAKKANVDGHELLRESATNKRREAKEARRKSESLGETARLMLTNRDPSLHLLPGFGKISDLIVSFRDSNVVPLKELNALPWSRVASLESPFAESINSRFAQFIGRIGVPDVEMGTIYGRLGLVEPV